jgi:hypothetical protein
MTEPANKKWMAAFPPIDLEGAGSGPLFLGPPQWWLISASTGEWVLVPFNPYWSLLNFAVARFERGGALRP